MVEWVSLTARLLVGVSGLCLRPIDLCYVYTHNAEAKTPLLKEPIKSPINPGDAVLSMETQG